MCVLFSIECVSCRVWGVIVAQKTHKVILTHQVYYSVEKLSKVDISSHKVCHFWHTFLIHTAPAKRHTDFENKINQQINK